MKNSLLPYSIGALLYCPANSHSLIQSLLSEKFGDKFSLALCLEDTIQDNSVEDAEHKLAISIQTLFLASQTQHFFKPKIFIRVRHPEQISRLLDNFGEARDMITGFILPKFDLHNVDIYIDTMVSVNQLYNQTFYMMPIFESPTIINLKDRYTILYTLKDKLDSVSELVLNIRVGGNDLCHQFGFRRHVDQSIHYIHPIASIFSDIITVFGMDYVVSGPVWEYYSGDGWDTGLHHELQGDRLCGFIGKTAIHPSQIPLINAAYTVTQKDYADALAILNWDETSPMLVSGSISKERMNEYKTHFIWAHKILMLAKTYGVTQ